MRRILFNALLMTTSILAATSAQASLVISGAATKNVNCAANVCTSTAKNAILNVSQLQGLLATSDVTVSTGAGASTIGVSAPLTWASTSRLTFSANQGVAIRAAVVVEGTGAITIAASGGALNFYPGGSISFWDNASSLIIGGQNYTLVSDIATLAADVSANPSGFYALAKNYDASGDSFSHSPMDVLTGTFEGLGNTLSNVSIRGGDGDPVGLFNEVDGAVRDLALSGSLSCFGAESDAAGLLAATNSGMLKTISVSGTVACNGVHHAGGVAGENTGTVSGATSSVNLPSSSNMKNGGGVAGLNAGTIQNSSASGSIAANIAGGLAGVSSGTVQDSHASGNVSAKGTGGGLVGLAQGSVAGSSASGAVTAKIRAGGLVGDAEALTVDSSFATGSAGAQTKQAGGLIGYGAHTTVTNSYARGAATVAGSNVGSAGGLAGGPTTAFTASYSTGAPSGGKFTGGSVGQTSSAMTNVYWDMDTSGITDPSKGAGNHPNYPGITGLSDAALKSGLPTGFDPAVWAQSPSINNGYPYLIANPPQ